MRLNFPSTWLANRQWPFQQANHGAYSNPGTQVGTQKTNFGAVSQTDLTGSLVSSVTQDSPQQLYETDEIFGEQYDRRLAGNHQNARTQTLFFHQVSDHGKLAIKIEDGTSQLASATLAAGFISPVDISLLLRNYSEEEYSRSLVDTYYY